MDPQDQTTASNTTQPQKDLNSNLQAIDKDQPAQSEVPEIDPAELKFGRNYVYDPEKWVTSKLDTIKKSSSLNSQATVLKETLQVNNNVLSINISSFEGKTAILELHFFEEGIFKLNCINPVNPSKFSFELVEKPANLSPYNISGHVVVKDDQIEVNLADAQAKVVINLAPFAIVVKTTREENKDEVLLQINANKSLNFDENLACDFTFSTEYLYGLPERADSLLLTDTRNELPYRFYNQDIPFYPLNSKGALYGAVPIIVSRKRNSNTLTSVYWQNTSDTYIEVHRAEQATNTFWLSERGNLECYVFVSHSNSSHYKAMSNVFGHCAMPQYFSLGYHQCRWSYLDQEDTLQVNEGFNKHEIPCDTITLDIDHTDGRRYFTFNDELYPDPAAMQAAFVADGRQLVTIADPHIKVDEKYHVYSDAIKLDLCVKDKDNKPFVGKCWPGDSIYLDFLNEETRQHWASQYRYDKYKHSTPNVWAWNDMNEPSVFEVPGNHMAIDNLQTFKTLAEPEKSFQVEHREVHNIYGYCHHKATYDGMVKRNEDQNIRPHVLSRSFYAGSQKFTTIWTGDTGSTWGYLKVTVPQLLSLSLCGISNVGGDIGGFMGDPEPELAIRWYQLGTFMPYFRGHSETTTKRREPWLYEKKYSDLIREAIRERYRLLPYWYTAFEDHCRSAVPLLRTVWFDQEGTPDQESMHEQDRYFIGDGLLVVPILEKGKTSISGALKGLKGRWYDYFTQKEVFGEDVIQTDLQRIGCFVKGGNIIPKFDIKSTTKSSQDGKQSDIHLVVGVNEEEKATGKLYFDDGETFDYKKGAFSRKSFEFNQNTLTWKEEHTGFAVKNKVTRVTIIGAKKDYASAYLVDKDQNKQKVQLVKESGNLVVEFSALAAEDFTIHLE